MKQQKIILQEDQIYKPPKVEQFSLKQFQKELQINILENQDDKLVFEMIHIQAPIANAIRRIMIAEIPTMAIHKVQVIQNTSIIPDEILAHRLGLIPIFADPTKFTYKEEYEDYNEKNSIIFNLNIKCEKQRNFNTNDPIEKQYTNTTVYSKNIIWQPQGVQQETFKNNPIRPVYDNIIVAKLRENQEITVKLICEKGIGKQHAKWSPVSTAFYKLQSNITFKSEIKDDRAKKLKQLCPKNVFDVKKGKAIVSNINACTSCRECIREANGYREIELSKLDDTFIFTIESVGQYLAKDIMLQAIDILRKKALLYIKE